MWRGSWGGRGSAGSGGLGRRVDTSMEGDSLACFFVQRRCVLEGLGSKTVFEREHTVWSCRGRGVK